MLFQACSVLAFDKGDSLIVPEFSIAGFYPLQNSPRKVYNFNPGWRFLKGDAKGAENFNFDDSSWEVVNAPHGLEILKENASGMRNYQGPAWYRKSFIAPSASKAGRIVIYFEAVMGKSKVWINGHKIAEHYGGYLPFAADITDHLNNEGERNIISVFTDNSDDPTYPPGKRQNQLDFAYLGGLYRDVYLVQMNSLHITLPEVSKTTAGSGVYVAVKDLQGNNAQMDIRTEIKNEGYANMPVIVRNTLEDATGKEIMHVEKKMTLLAGRSEQMIQSINPKQVHLWHPDDPYLHFIKTEVWSKGKIVDSYRTRFGIRLFEMRGADGFFVNKKYIGHKLSGANRHQDYAYVGNALTNSGQWRDAKLLREGGVTIIRATHYPFDPAFMDACDELGILVTVATPGWQFFNEKDSIFGKRVMEDVCNMARRDRNRPSVILWETALNETKNQPISMLKELHRITHEEMPYPGVFTATDVTHAKLAGFDFYYHGDFQKDKNSFTREYGDGEEVENFFSQNAMTRVKREWGEQAMLNQARIRAVGLDEIFSTPRVRIGGAIWCGIDHQRGYHPDPFWGGLLDVFRIPRYSYYLFKSQYVPDFQLNGIKTGPMIYITHELTQVSGSDVIIFSNCDEVRLTWLGKVMGVQKADSALRHMPHPPFIFRNVFDFHEISRDWRSRSNKIEMIAEGLINGKVVCTQVKKYPERSAGIKLVVDASGVGIAADGSDFVPVRAIIVDHKGVPKVLASEYVTFEVSGNGSLIGGEENTINPVKTQFGSATILVRAGVDPGMIKIKATADGLKGDEVSFSTRPSPLPLLFTDSLSVSSAKRSIPETKNTQKKVISNDSLQQLKEENIRLLQELTSKEQEIMEMRNKRGE